MMPKGVAYQEVVIRIHGSNSEGLTLPECPDPGTPGSQLVGQRLTRDRTGVGTIPHPLVIPEVTLADRVPVTTPKVSQVDSNTRFCLRACFNRCTNRLARPAASANITLRASASASGSIDSTRYTGAGAESVGWYDFIAILRGS